MRARQSLKLTKRSVEAITPTAAEVYVWDTELSGFAVRVYPTGRKAFIAQYRNRLTGRQGKSKIGDFGVVTAEQARSRAADILAENQLGASIKSLEKRQVRSLQAVYEEWSVTAALTHRKTGRVRPDASVQNDRHYMSFHVLPALGKRDVTSISRVDVEALRDKTRKKISPPVVRKGRGHRGSTGGPGVASRVIATLQSILSYAVDKGYLTANPCSGVKLDPSAMRQRFLSEQEMSAVVSSIEAMRAAGVNERGLDILLLLLWTGARKSEITDLKWDEVDFNTAHLRLLKSKTGPRPIPLSETAVSILRRQAREKSPHVFPSIRRADQPFRGIKGIWLQVQVRAKLPGVRVHDLRHTMASQLAAGGAGLYDIGKILGHKKQQTTARYAHLTESHLQSQVEAVSLRVTGQAQHK
ncbi:MAG: tyrosine-type recombinase/integrase [Hyphomonadaceae bacterium]|nr:tyrosine-type recombinase/integrase [Hyphomonadaceae bacterium]